MLKVASGTCTIAEKPIGVAQAAMLTESPVDPSAAPDESVTMPDNGACRPLAAAVLNGQVVPGAVVPSSVKVWSGSGSDRRSYRAGRDFVLNPETGSLSREKNGSIAAGQTVTVSYGISQMRLDTIEVRADGSVELKKGEPGPAGVEPAAVDPGALAIAHVLMVSGMDKIDRDAIYSIGQIYPLPKDTDRVAMVASVSHTRARLQSNQKVTLVFWGDSVKDPAKGKSVETFPDMVVHTLDGEFKGAQITLVRSGGPGTTLHDRLAHIGEDVLLHHPDLVVIEFAGDMSLPASTIRSDYTSAVKQIKDAGSDVILATPNFVAPGAMGMKSLRGKDPRKGVEVLREVAASQKVGLADVSRRWEHLAQEGLPYVTLLADGVSFPDARGQEISAQAIGSFF
jgi:hypothetical protein